MTIKMPTVRNICATDGAARTRAINCPCTTQPIANATAKDNGAARTGSSPRKAQANQAVNIPMVRNSACAKFTMPITP